MTFLNTCSNLGTMWIAPIMYKMVDVWTWKENEQFPCEANGSGNDNSEVASGIVSSITSSVSSAVCSATHGTTNLIGLGGVFLNGDGFKTAGEQFPFLEGHVPVEKKGTSPILIDGFYVVSGLCAIWGIMTFPMVSKRLDLISGHKRDSWAPKRS
jgi:hypothetical protein